MRADPDFTSYVVARWLPVVRVLVVLGLPVDRAEDVAVAAFARLLPDWTQFRREGDVDVELARVVLDGWVRARDPHPVRRAPVPVPAARVLTQELEDQLALLGRLVDGLDRLDETTRVTVVLHHLGELDEAQVAELLAQPRSEVGRRLAEAAATLDLVPLDPACHSAATAIDVPPPPVGRVFAQAGAVRRRRWLVTGAVAGAVLVVAGLSYLLGRPSPAPDPDALDVSPVENAVDVAWWSDGILHLAHGTIQVADVTQLVETGVGVAYVDGNGAVTSVTEDGIQRELGSLAPGTVLVAQPRFGWVAWAQPDGGELVVYDAINDREVTRLDAEDDTQLIGWDRERFYYRSGGSEWAATFSGASVSTPDPVVPPDGYEGSALLDVASGSQLRRKAGTLSVVHPFFSIHSEVPGSAGLLSPDGNFVLTQLDEEQIGMRDARDGQVDGDWFVRRGWTPVAAAFTVEGRVVWVVDRHDGSHAMYECQASKDYLNSFNPDEEPCTQGLEVEGVPLLAGAPPGLGLASGE